MTAHPKYSMNYLTRGAMYTEKGDTVKALADYDKAISMDPTMLRLWQPGDPALPDEQYERRACRSERGHSSEYP